MFFAPAKLPRARPRGSTCRPSRCLVGRHGARAPGAHDDRVEIGLSHVPLLSLPSLFSNTVRAPCPPRITEAKAATRRGAASLQGIPQVLQSRPTVQGGRQRRESKGGCPACPPSEFPLRGLAPLRSAAPHPSSRTVQWTVRASQDCRATGHAGYPPGQVEKAYRAAASFGRTSFRSPTRP